MSDELGLPDIKTRVAGGAMLMAGRGVVIRVIGLGSSIALARLLEVSDFGIVAFGFTVLGIGTFLADGGVGAYLIRQEDPPSTDQLRSVVGFQLAITGLFAAVVVAIATAAGGDALVTGVMALALPLTAFRNPSIIMLNRSLDFRAVARIEIAETLTSTVWSVGGAALGFGVWALATSVIARSIVGTVLALRASPATPKRPVLSLAALRPILGFGMRFQANGVATVARDAGLNATILAMGGTAGLGYWGLAQRVLQVPYIVFETLWRVAFPAFARLGDPRKLGPIIDRSIGLVAVGTALTLVPLAASSEHLIAQVFGGKWQPVADIIPWASLALVLGGPLSVSAIGFLYSVGDAGTPVVATIITGAVWILGVALGFDSIGMAVIGGAWVLATLAEIPILLPAVFRHTRIHLVGMLWRPLVLAVATVVAGRLALEQMPSNLAVSIIVGGVAEAAFVGLIFTFDRTQFNDMSSTVSKGIAAIRSRAV